MKYQYNAVPKSMSKMCTYGFSWMEFVLSIPSPVFLVTSYKSNNLPNACMQSWATFTGNENGFYAILSAVNKKGHLYQTLIERKEAVINFMSLDLYDRCMATIQNNQFDKDELSSSGLTSVPASMVDAPMVEECFMNLECRFVWEKAIREGDDYTIVCLEVVNVHIDEDHIDENKLGRTGDTGILYNIHHPINPENFKGTAHDWVGVVKKIRDYGEY